MGPALKLLVFADPQGNPWAVEAILRAARKVEDAEVTCLGNAVGVGPDPQATVERLRKARVHLVRGPRDAAALGRPVPEALRAEGKANAARLKPADLAYLRESTPPRRLVAGGKRVLVTAEAAPDAGNADVVLKPGPRTVVAQAGPVLVVMVAPADDPTGESPYVVWDSETGEARVHHAAWDADRRRAAGRA